MLIRPCLLRNRAGFTLIELLIVIAIILILIAIALPNFLEAQIRARVANGMSELRTLQTAFESYRTDYPCYPRGRIDGNPNGEGYGEGWGMITEALTTPIKYLTEIPFDRFFSPNYDIPGTPDTVPEGHPYTRYRTTRRRCWSHCPMDEANADPANCVDGEFFAFPDQYELVNPEFWSRKEYLLSSLGPDKKEDIIPFYAGGPGYVVGAEFYAPTNGTKSGGDLIIAGP